MSSPVVGAARRATHERAMTMVRNGAKKPAEGKKGTRVKRNGTNPALNKDEDLPEGFEDVFQGVVGWFYCDEKTPNTARGWLTDTFETKSKLSPTGKKRVYKMELTRPGTLITTGTIEGTKDPIIEVANVGDVIGIDEKGWLKRLANVELGREVYVKCLGKDAASDEYPMGAWRFKVGVNSSGEVKPPAGIKGNTNDSSNGIGDEPTRDTR